MNNLVSILIPVFNTEEFVSKAIESVVAQTYEHLEIVIVDDCSTDNTYKLCENHQKTDERIRLFKNSQNLGMMANWNYGLTLCKGKYWGKLDADDWWEPDFVEKCVEILDKDKEVGLVCSGHIEIGPGGEHLRTEKTPKDFQSRSIYFSELVRLGPARMLSYPIARQGIGLLRTVVFTDLGPFTLLDAGDTEMWFRIGCHNKVHFLSGIHHHHRIWEENFTRSKVINQGKKEKNLYEVKRAILDYYKTAKKISEAKHKTWLSQIDFEYQTFLVYKNRLDNEWGEMYQRLSNMFFQHPLRFMRFYLQRAIGK